MINLPHDVLETIFSSLDPISLSNMCIVHPVFNQFILANKWRIVDNFGELVKVFPRTQATYKAWRYIVDLTHCILPQKKVDEDVLIEFKDNPDINWRLVCANQKLSEDTLRILYPVIPLASLLTQQVLPLDLLEKVINENTPWDDVYWYHIFAHQKIDYLFIQKYMSYVNWHAVSQNKYAISFHLIANHSNNVIWPEITKHGLNQDLIEAQLEYSNLDRFSWINVAMHSQLSTSFIQKHFLNLPVSYLVRCQDLEEDMIRYIVHADNNYDDFLVWDTIAEFQKLSFEFICEYKNKLSLTLLIRNMKVRRVDLERLGLTRF